MGDCTNAQLPQIARKTLRSAYLEVSKLDRSRIETKRSRIPLQSQPAEITTTSERSNGLNQN